MTVFSVGLGIAEESLHQVYEHMHIRALLTASYQRFLNSRLTSMTVDQTNAKRSISWALLRNSPFHAVCGVDVLAPELSHVDIKLFKVLEAAAKIEPVPLR